MLTFYVFGVFAFGLWLTLYANKHKLALGIRDAASIILWPISVAYLIGCFCYGIYLGIQDRKKK